MAASASSLPCGRAQAGAVDGSRASSTAALPPESRMPPAAGALESAKARANSDAVVAPASGSRVSLGSAQGRAGASADGDQPGEPPPPLMRSTAAAAAAAKPPGEPNDVPT